MRNINCLNSDDLRKSIAIAAELHALNDQTLRCEHLSGRLCSLFRAKVCCIGEVPRHPELHEMPWTPYAEHGWLDSTQRQTLFASLNEPGASDPMIRDLVTINGACVTRTRSELINNERWYNSRFVGGFRTAAGLDDQLYTTTNILERRGWLGIIGLHREAGDTLFNEHDAVLLDALNHALGSSLWRSASPTSERRNGHADSFAGLNGRIEQQLANLTPAQRRILPFMLQGHSEQKIADMLGRSRHTVHDHVLAIYRELEVGTRVELVLKLTGQRQESSTPPAEPISLVTAPDAVD